MGAQGQKAQSKTDRRAREREGAGDTGCRGRKMEGEESTGRLTPDCRVHRSAPQSIRHGFILALPLSGGFNNSYIFTILRNLQKIESKRRKII